MKRAKITLTGVAIFAAIGSLAALKANRGLNTFYKYTTAVLNGQVTGICEEPVQLTLIRTVVGGIVTTVSCSPAQSVTTCTCRVTANL
jgi:hypothetical protein